MMMGIMAGQMRSAVASPGGLPSVIGEAFGGGYYIGDITVSDGGADDGTYAIIMAGASADIGRTYGTRSVDVTGAVSLTNGMANTIAIGVVTSLDVAANYCANYVSGAYSDWYLPAKSELNLAYVNRAALAALGLGPTGSYNYWSSTQLPADGFKAWLLDVSGGYAYSTDKSGSYRVRPARRIRK